MATVVLVPAGGELIEITPYILAFGDLAPLGFILVIIFIIVGAILGRQEAKKRRAAIAAWARSLGLSFDPSEDHDMDDRFREFSRLRRGSGRYAFNTVSGSHRGRHVLAFDYHYETTSTDSDGDTDTDHHYFSAVIIDAGLPLKQLFIRPEGLFDKFNEFIGFDDIDFESTEFSSKFFVKSEDRKWAFDVIHQDTMEFLLASPTFHLEFSGRYVIAYNDSKFEVEEFAAALRVIEGVLDRFPKYLVRELQGAR